MNVQAKLKIQYALNSIGKNTIFTRTVIRRFPAVDQAHLERIVDYIVPGKGIWWRENDDGIEFLDGRHDNHRCIKATPLFFKDIFLKQMSVIFILKLTSKHLANSQCDRSFNILAEVSLM